MRFSVSRADWETGLLVIFFVIYYSPQIFGAATPPTADSAIADQIAALLATTAAQADLLLNVAAHLLSAGLLASALIWLGSRFSEVARIRPILGQSLVLATGWLTLVAWNHKLFPLTDYAFALSFMGKSSQLATITAFFLLLVGAALAQTWRTNRPYLARSTPLITSLIAASAFILAISSEAAPRLPGKSILVLGIDSLSGSTFEQYQDELPVLKNLVSNGTYYSRAYTPLARTFPAWTSVLTGRNPAEHGAVFNLRRLDAVSRADLITTELREKNYRTIFALDERRFSNIDESFGFDQVIGPKAGALDFALQTLNDTPLTNLILQTRLGKIFFPHSHVNTASHANYNPGLFADLIADAVRDSENNVFVAAHFETAHMPFNTAHSKSDFSHANEFLTRQIRALTVVDRQIGRLLERLKQDGYLEDALVVILSDHGESLGETEFITTKNGDPFKLSGYGHGMSVLSEQQTRVVLSATEFKRGRLLPNRRTDPTLLSLTDLRGALHQYAKGKPFEITPSADCVHIETGLRLKSAENYKTLDKSAVTREGAKYYEISPSGRLQLRESRLPELISGKDVALRCNDKITYFSADTSAFYAYDTRVYGTLTETTPSEQDTARIDRYRTRLMASAPYVSP